MQSTREKIFYLHPCPPPSVSAHTSPVVFIFACAVGKNGRSVDRLGLNFFYFCNVCVCDSCFSFLLSVFSLSLSAGQTSSQSQTSQPMPKLEDWLEKWEKRRKTNETKDSAEKSGQQSTYTLPPGLPPLQLLPPSLLPPPPNGYPQVPRVEWG